MITAETRRHAFRLVRLLSNTPGVRQCPQCICWTTAGTIAQRQRKTITDMAPHIKANNIATAVFAPVGNP
jgi:hypothetical protein